MNEDQPHIVNPDAVGNPDDTPVVQLSSGTVAAMRRAELICECGGMNGWHHDECARSDDT